MRSSDWSSDVCSSDLEQPEYRYSWGRQNWFDHAAAEHKAVREGVGLFALTSFAKFRVEGRDAEAVLQRISANDVAVAPGRILYTPWLTDRAVIVPATTPPPHSAPAPLSVPQTASATSRT